MIGKLCSNTCQYLRIFGTIKIASVCSSTGFPMTCPTSSKEEITRETTMHQENMHLQPTSDTWHRQCQNKICGISSVSLVQPPGSLGGEGCVCVCEHLGGEGLLPAQTRGGITDCLKAHVTHITQWSAVHWLQGHRHVHDHRCMQLEFRAF